MGTTDYTFSHPRGSLFGYPTESDDTLQEMTDESTPLDNLDYNHYMSTLSTVIMYNCNTVSDLAASDIVNHQICLSTHLNFASQVQ